MIAGLFQVMNYSRKKNKLGIMWKHKPTERMLLRTFNLYNEKLKIWWAFGNEGPVLHGDFSEVLMRRIFLMGISQEKAAVRSGISLVRIGEIVRGDSGVNLLTIEKICTGLGFQYEIGEVENE